MGKFADEVRYFELTKEKKTYTPEEASFIQEYEKSSNYLKLIKKRNSGLHLTNEEEAFVFSIEDEMMKSSKGYLGTLRHFKPNIIDATQLQVKQKWTLFNFAFDNDCKATLTRLLTENLDDSDETNQWIQHTLAECKKRNKINLLKPYCKFELDKYNVEKLTNQYLRFLKGFYEPLSIKLDCKPKDYQTISLALNHFDNMISAFYSCLDTTIEKKMNAFQSHFEDFVIQYLLDIIDGKTPLDTLLLKFVTDCYHQLLAVFDSDILNQWKKSDEIRLKDKITEFKTFLLQKKNELSNMVDSNSVTPPTF